LGGSGKDQTRQKLRPCLVIGSMQGVHHRDRRFGSPRRWPCPRPFSGQNPRRI